MLLRFEKYSSYYHVNCLSLNENLDRARSILLKYKRSEWFHFLTFIAKEIFLGEPKKLERLHNELYQKSDFIIVHRRANLLIAQLLFSLNESQFSLNSNIITQDHFELYLIINECLDLTETEVLRGTADQNFLFNTFKIVSTSFCESDLKINLSLFIKYYEKICDDPNSTIIKRLIQNEFHVDFETIISFLKSFQDSKSKLKPLTFLDKLIGLDYDEIDSEWQNRKPKLPLPFEYNFVEKFSFVNHGNNHYVFDIYSLFNSVITSIYNILFNQSRFDFRGYFGKKIVEPIILKRLSDHFLCDGIKALKVQTRKYEYADFGLILNRDIYLFELKSAFFSPEIRYTRNWDYFFESFNGKYVKNSGIEQQVKHLFEIDNNIKRFCELNDLPVFKYKIHPILIVFDEGLQCYGCNSHLNTYYQSSIKNISPSLINIKISNNYCLLTINEIEFLAMKFTNVYKRLDLIRSYIDLPNKILPFRGFLDNIQ